MKKRFDLSKTGFAVSALLFCLCSLEVALIARLLAQPVVSYAAIIETHGWSLAAALVGVLLAFYAAVRLGFGVLATGFAGNIRKGLFKT